MSKEYVTLTIDNQLFGIPVERVQDVLGQHKLTHVPNAPPFVAGALNLRGRIVTGIDMRKRLGLKPLNGDGAGMSLVVDFQGELYSLMVDRVEEVLTLDEDNVEDNPPTLDKKWRDISAGIVRLQDHLLIKVNVERLLEETT